MSLATLLVVLFASFLSLSSTVDAADRPNIVVLYADDLGYGDLAIQNPDSKIPTPQLDQLAREGLRFTDAHSSASICSPSRYALLTGRYHWRRHHRIVDSFGPSAFAPDDVTLPQTLRNAGYRTACIGKWHLGWDWDAIKRPGAQAEPKVGYPVDAFAAPDSVDLLTVWKSNAASPRRTIVHASPEERYAIRHDEWVLIDDATGEVTKVPGWFDKQHGYAKHDQPGELYNVRHDLAQRDNLYASQPARVAQLRQLLDEARGEPRSEPAP